MRISDWSSDVCSSDLIVHTPTLTGFGERHHLISRDITTATHVADVVNLMRFEDVENAVLVVHSYAGTIAPGILAEAGDRISHVVYIDAIRSEEHTSELQSLMRISYAVICLKKKKHRSKQSINEQQQTRVTQHVR